MGFVVGGIFGGLMGTYYAVMSRSIIYIPTAAIASGCSFGFFMGIGMVMRTEMEGEEKTAIDFEKSQFMVTKLDKESGRVERDIIYSKYIL